MTREKVSKCCYMLTQRCSSARLPLTLTPPTDTAGISQSKGLLCPPAAPRELPAPAPSQSVQSVPSETTVSEGGLLLEPPFLFHSPEAEHRGPPLTTTPQLSPTHLTTPGGTVRRLCCSFCFLLSAVFELTSCFLFLHLLCQSYVFLSKIVSLCNVSVTCLFGGALIISYLSLRSCRSLHLGVFKVISI